MILAKKGEMTGEPLIVERVIMVGKEEVEEEVEEEIKERRVEGRRSI